MTKTKTKLSKFDSSLWNDPGLAKSILSHIEKITEKIFSKTSKSVNIMEVCGTHTMAIAASGMRNLLPKGLRMLSGPGCPVCVTSQGDIDRILQISRIEGVITATFGDMMKVKGSNGLDLSSSRERGADIRMVYSPMDGLEIAKENPGKKIVFVGVGFETTAPAIAATLVHAHNENVNNFFVIPFFKLVPPALELILSIPGHRISGFILPGHVSAIIGSDAYGEVVKKYRIPCVVSGFEPLDILRGINMLLMQIESGEAKVENEYSRVVTAGGNQEAQKVLMTVFEIADAAWRAIGSIKGTGLSLKGEYKKFNGLEHFGIQYVETPEPKGCICGEILMGRAMPADCKMFGKVCTPSDAVGPCMVSSEGACAAWYKYRE